MRLSPPRFALIGLILAPVMAFAQEPAPSSNVAAEAFTKTFAAGTNKWSFKNAIVSVKTTGNGKTATSVLKCSSDQVSSIGVYPKILFNIGSLSCNKTIPTELLTLQLLARHLGYDATHIPTSSDPSQFRLNLRTAELGPFPRWKRIESMNALTRDNVVYMDLVGETRDVVLFGSTYYFLQITLQREPAGSEESLSAELTIDDYLNPSNSQKTEISLKTQLQRN
jgi:hypothetical protein